MAALKEKKRCLKVLFRFDYDEGFSFFEKTLFYLFPSRIIKRANLILEKIIMRRDEYQKFVSSEKGQKLLKENKCSL